MRLVSDIVKQTEHKRASFINTVLSNMGLTVLSNMCRKWHTFRNGKWSGAVALKQEKKSILSRYIFKLFEIFFVQSQKIIFSKISIVHL